MNQHRTKDVAHTILEILDRCGTVGNKLLFTRVEREHSCLGGREYSDALMQLRELNLVRCFDGVTIKSLKSLIRECQCLRTSVDVDTTTIQTII